jgi:hypothetical protein
MQKFLKSEDYQTMKLEYEKTYFKLLGDYVYYNGDTITNKSPSAIREYFKNKKIYIKEDRENANGDITTIKKEKSFYDIWSEDPDMKEYTEVTFDCDVKNVPKHKFNLFDGFKIKDHKISDKEKAREGLELINKHIEILRNHNKEHVKLVKWFYAQALQKPHELPNICLVFISKEGVGKDLFSEFIEKIFGEKYCYNTDKLDNVCGKFNSIHGGKIIGVINETNPVDSQQRRDNIKYIVTANKFLIEGKHKDPVKTKNYCRMVFYANRLTAFPIEEGGRRPFVFYCSKEMLPKYCGAEKSKEYFDNLLKVIADKDVQKAYYDELMKIDVKNFNHKEIAKSDLQQDMEENARSPIVEFFYKFLYTNLESKLTIKASDLLKLYNEFLKERNMKFDVSAKSFNIDVVHEFKLRKFLSCGVTKFEINVEQCKKYLTEEYKLSFDDSDENSDNDSDADYDHGITKQDLRINATTAEKIAHYTQLLRDLHKQYAEELMKSDKPTKVTKVTKDEGYEKYFDKVYEKEADKKLKTYDTQSKNLEKKEIPKINFATF